jgi:hypothetical protein
MSFGNVTKKVNAYKENVEYYRCDHAFVSQKEKKNNTPEVKKRSSRPKLNVIYKLNGSVFVTYYWKYSNHNSSDCQDTVDSRISEEIRTWIEHIEKHMHWKSIKALLRMNPEELNDVNSVYVND